MSDKPFETEDSEPNGDEFDQIGKLLETAGRSVSKGMEFDGEIGAVFGMFGSWINLMEYFFSGGGNSLLLAIEDTLDQNNISKVNFPLQDDGKIDWEALVENLPPDTEDTNIFTTISTLIGIELEHFFNEYENYITENFKKRFKAGFDKLSDINQEQRDLLQMYDEATEEINDFETSLGQSDEPNDADQEP